MFIFFVVVVLNDLKRKIKYKNENLSLRLVIFSSHVWLHRYSDRVRRELDLCRIQALLSKYEKEVHLSSHYEVR